MKKKGFSLAEVLITLTIIGVVAAMSIPQFTANVHNQSNASKLAPIVADYENIFGMMLLREDRENIFDTNFGTALSDTVTEFINRLEAYTKVARADSSLQGLGYNGGFQNIDGTGNSTPGSKAILTPSGAVIVFSSISNNTSTVYIDVNGPTSPNRYGRDVFEFVLAQDGHLYPYGSRQAAVELGIGEGQTWDSNNAIQAYRCTGNNYTGEGCTARLIENNYKMDY